MKRIDIYCESAPISERYVAYGLSRAITSIYHSISEDVENVIVFPVDGRVHVVALDDAASRRTVVLANVVAKVVSKIENKNARLGEFLSDFWLGCAATNKHESEFCFAVIGASYRALLRAVRLAKIRKQRLIVYFVDDLIVPISHLDKEKIDIIYIKIAAALNEIELAFCITEGLCRRFKALFDFDSLRLHLPFGSSSTLDSCTRKKQVIYVGAINFLYASTISWMLDSLMKYNNAQDEKIVFRFTIAEDIFLRQFGALPPWVVCQPIPNRDELISEVGSSIAAVMPYSFEDAPHVMVETSFPSKLLDYLYAARRIIVVAPKYSSLYAYFEQDDWMRICSMDCDFVAEIIAANKGEDHRTHYRNRLMERHSLKGFAETFRSAITGLNHFR
jgi:hypothetical protein